MRERGFTLIEIIIATILFSFLIIGFYKANMTYIETTNMRSEYTRLEKMQKSLNIDLMRGRIPDSSNISDFIRNWAGEGIKANNFSRNYYLIIPSGLRNALRDTNNLCSSINSINSVFKIKTLDGEIKDNVIYLLVSPTGKGESVLAINNLQGGSNLIEVSQNSVIELSPFDMVRFETKDSYQSFCNEMNRDGGDAKKYAGCDFIITDDASMNEVSTTYAGMLDNRTVCIEPGNYNTNLMIYGQDTILKQINPGVVRVNQAGFASATRLGYMSSLYIVGLTLKAGSLTFGGAKILVLNSDIEAQAFGNSWYTNPLILKNSKLNIVSGNSNLGHYFQAILDENSTMTVGGDIVFYTLSLSLRNGSTMSIGGKMSTPSDTAGSTIDISLSGNSTMNVAGDINVGDSNSTGNYNIKISLDNSTMTVNGNVSVNGWYYTMIDISLSRNSAMTVGGSLGSKGMNISLSGNSAMTVGGIVIAGSYSFSQTTLSLDNSTMTVNRDVNVNSYYSSISLSGNSTMRVNGNMNAGGWDTNNSAISLDNSTMTVNGNVSVMSIYASSISLSGNSAMTVGGSVKVSSRGSTTTGFNAQSTLSLDNSTMTVNGDVSVSVSSIGWNKISIVSLRNSMLTVMGNNGVQGFDRSPLNNSCIRANRFGSFTPTTTIPTNTRLVPPDGNCN